MPTITERYLATTAKVDFLSKLAAMLIFVYALCEVGWVVRLVINTPDPATDVVQAALLSPSIYAIFFGVRFFWLFRNVGLAGRILSWWGCVAAVFLDIETGGGPQPGAIYDLFRTFPLLSLAFLFVAVGTIKFSLTILGVMLGGYRNK